MLSRCTEAIWGPAAHFGNQVQRDNPVATCFGHRSSVFPELLTWANHFLRITQSGTQLWPVPYWWCDYWVESKTSMEEKLIILLLNSMINVFICIETIVKQSSHLICSFIFSLLELMLDRKSRNWVTERRKFRWKRPSFIHTLYSRWWTSSDS